MPRHRRYEPLNIFLNSRLVGQLRRAPSGATSFQYDGSWLAWQHTMPVSLSLPLQEDAYSGAPVRAVFENLLPDNDELRRRIAARAHAEGTDAYSLLSAIGHDCVGALQFLPPEREPGPAGAVDGTPVSSGEIAEILDHLATTPLGITEDEEFRISIAGAQEKTALLRWKEAWYKPRGTTATTHIFKPSIGRLPNGVDLTHSVENEYLCLRLLESLGLAAAKARMTRFGDRPVLIVERFDRHWSEDGRLLRLPQEDSCQALSIPPTRKYESEGGPGITAILRLLRDSDTPAEDQRAFLKTIVVFWLMGATDGHAKNFSVFLYPGGRYRMTPLYDAISAQPSVDAGQIRQNSFRLAMAVGDNRHYQINTIVPRHFLQSAEHAGVGEEIVHSIFGGLRETGQEAIARTLDHLPARFPKQVSASIRAGFLRRLELIERT
jgi:serine/threonine-protein kinase HipA